MVTEKKCSWSSKFIERVSNLFEKPLVISQCCETHSPLESEFEPWMSIYVEKESSANVIQLQLIFLLNYPGLKDFRL